MGTFICNLLEHPVVINSAVYAKVHAQFLRMLSWLSPSWQWVQLVCWIAFPDFKCHQSGTEVITTALSPSPLISVSLSLLLVGLPTIWSENETNRGSWILFETNLRTTNRMARSPTSGGCAAMDCGCRLDVWGALVNRCMAMVGVGFNAVVVMISGGWPRQWVRRGMHGGSGDFGFVVVGRDCRAPGGKGKSRSGVSSDRGLSFFVAQVERGGWFGFFGVVFLFTVVQKVFSLSFDLPFLLWVSCQILWVYFPMENREYCG